MIILTYIFIEANNHPTHSQSSFSHQCKIHTLFHLFDKNKKINKKYGRKRKGKPFQRKHEHECMEEHKLDKRTNLVNDKKKFLLTIATSFDTRNRFIIGRQKFQLKIQIFGMKYMRKYLIHSLWVSFCR